MQDANPTADAPRFTAEQSRPLETVGFSVALSAGAGCGKTTVLTERFLRAIGGVEARPLTSMVALTFTDKAASELRGRIRDECRRRVDQTDGDVKARWKFLLRGLDAAPIGTFHSYCTGLLRRHAAVAGLDADFEVLNAVIAATLREEAILRSTRRWLAAREPDVIALGIEFGLDRVRAAVDSLVKLRDGSELELWARRTPEELLAAWRVIWNERGKPALAKPLLDTSERCRRWLVDTPLEHAKLKPWKADLSAQLIDLPRNIEDYEWLAALREASKLPRGLRKEHWPSVEANESTKAILESLRDAIVDWMKATRWSEPSTLQAADFGIRFARLALDARAEYDRAKRAINSLDFDDLIVATRDLLRDHVEEVVADGENAVGFVLVDEFQDTDPVQAELLRSLAGVEFEAGRLFLVGDFKQSIYRFRGARPQLFQEFRDAFPNAGRLALTENFRSATGISQFVNRLFAGAFSADEPELAPGPDASRPEGLFPVEFVWAVEPGEDQSQKVSAEEGREVEARWLARRIRTGIESGWTVKDRKTKAMRNADPGDVAFLFRSLNDLAAYENALVKEGLDYYVVGGKAFYNQQEVQDIINILSWIEDPFDALALVATLRSPFFAVSDEGLFWLRTAFDRDLVENLANVERILDVSPSDRDRLHRANDLLTTFRGLKDRVPIAELVDRVLVDTGYESALLAEFLGDRKRGNARKLVKLAESFDDQPGFTLARFVARLRADQNHPPSEGEAGTTNEDGQAVRLMTIHQSKGLEFPIVVVPDLNRGGNNKTSLVTFRSELGPVVHAKTSADDDSNEFTEESESERSLGSAVYNVLEKEEEAEEAVRLFYVAATRARDRLILSAAFDPSGMKAAKSEALRLLGARFDLNSGWSLNGDPPLQVQVTTVPPPALETARPRKARPRLRAMSRIIQSSRVVESVETKSPSSAWRGRKWVDLDELRGLEGRNIKLDRFVRALLKDPSVFIPGELEGLAARLARRQVPCVQNHLIAEAVALLRTWPEGVFENLFAESLLVERGMPWTIAWPIGSIHPTVFGGWADFLSRDERGAWTVLNFSTPGSPDPIERLRSKLSARAAEAMGMGPVLGSCRVRLGVLELFDLDNDFSDESIEEILDQLID